jgi:broad specificity phosphatase PhoE
MKHLYFVRHGITQHNIDGIFSTLEVPLSHQGIEQARQAGRMARDQGIRFDKIIASPLPRTVTTAEVIAGEVGYPHDLIEHLDLLKERFVGRLTGTPYNQYYVEGRIYKDIDKIEGAETVADLQARAEHALQFIKSRAEDTILVVSHGAFGRAFRRAVQGTPYTDEFRDNRPHDLLQNATIIKLI